MAVPKQRRPTGLHVGHATDPKLQHARKSRYRRASGLCRRWRDGDGIAQFSKVVQGALGQRDQSALRHNFGIRAAVPNSVVENFPYDAYLIMRDRPSSLLGAKPRTPALEAPLGLAAFRRYGRPSCLAEGAPQHPVPFGRAAAYRRAGAFLLAWDTSQPTRLVYPPPRMPLLVDRSRQ